MAVELIVGPIVSASVEFLLKKIASSHVASFMRGKKDSGFDVLLDKLETTLLSLAEVLSDAELKQFTNPRVEKWLDKLQDAVDDAEDLFDEIEYDALKLAVEAESEPDKSKVSKFISSFNSTDEDRKTDMEKLLQRLDTFEKKRYILDLQKGVEKIQSQRPPSISSIDDSEFFGRNDEMKILKGMLLSDDVGGEKICVIPIVGMGGIGKTTLAQALYNDDEVNVYFEFKAWVCVSDEFDVRKVTKNVLEAVTGHGCAVENLNVLQGKIQERLKGKKFLIVLDDVWNEEYVFWDTMRMLFKVGAQGSKIIVTTRSEIVASIMGTTASRHLEELKEEACFKLFVKIVSGNKAFTVESDLGRMGKDIVKKCKGLPLAVKALASLLRLTDVKEWKRIANSDVLDLPVGEKNILPALRLSYHYLPLHLKRCFVYCSLFPKDYEFTLPPLGQLPALKILLIEGCHALETVGLDFYGASYSKSFPSLEFLSLLNMLNWKEWSLPKANVEVFPKLTSLTIKVCEKLTGNLPYILPSLTKLRIFQCPELASSLPMMPSVTTIDVNQWEKIGGFKSCSSLQDFPVKLENLYLSFSDNLDFLPPSDYKCLQKLYVDDISSSFKFLLLDSFPNIRKVELRHCELESLSAANSLNFLSTLRIDECPNFTLMPDTNLHCPILTQLCIRSCGMLKFLPESLPSLLPSLQELSIIDCPELEFLPRSGLPFSLCKLTFGYCGKLKLLSDQQPNILPCLRELDLYGCPELEYLPRSWLSFSLSELSIRNCTKVIACRQNWNLQELPNLTSFHICEYNGEDMESFLEQGSLPTSLTSLRIKSVAHLKTLDVKGFQELTSLKELFIYNCPNLQTLPVKGLPPSFEGSLPLSFESFLMNGCPLLEAKYEWEKENIYNSLKISCSPQPQVPISRQPQLRISPQWLLTKPSFSWFESKALLFHIALILLCICLYMYFNF